MSGERVDGIDPLVLNIECDLFLAGFDPCVPGEQAGFWVENQGHIVIWWLPEDFSERLDDGHEMIRFEEREEAQRWQSAYTNFLNEMIEERERQEHQQSPEYYEGQN